MEDLRRIIFLIWRSGDLAVASTWDRLFQSIGADWVISPADYARIEAIVEIDHVGKKCTAAVGLAAANGQN